MSASCEPSVNSLRSVANILTGVILMRSVKNPSRPLLPTSLRRPAAILPRRTSPITRWGWRSGSRRWCMCGRWAGQRDRPATPPVAVRTTGKTRSGPVVPDKVTLAEVPSSSPTTSTTAPSPRRCSMAMPPCCSTTRGWWRTPGSTSLLPSGSSSPRRPRNRPCCT